MRAIRVEVKAKNKNQLKIKGHTGNSRNMHLLNLADALNLRVLVDEKNRIYIDSGCTADEIEPYNF